MFAITENAAKQIQVAIKQSNAEGMVLRVAAKIGDDRNIQYAMGFDEVRDGESSVDINGVQIVIDSGSSDLLEETTLDFVELEPGNSQFIFKNPLDPSYVPPKEG